MFKIKFEHLLIFLVITIGIVSSTIKLNAQPGFNKLYEFPNSGGVSFSNIQSKNDKTILSGNILIDSSNLWGVIICTIDTSGAVIDYHTYSDSNGNNLLFESTSDLIFTSDGEYVFGRCCI